MVNYTFAWPSNFSNGTIVNGTGTLIQYANYVSDGWLSYAFLLIIFLMSFSTGVMISSRKALLSASFITFVFSIYFLRLDIIHYGIPFILVAIMIIGALGSRSEGKY